MASANAMAVGQALYAALARRDGAAMGSWYADNAVFSDPAFPRLEGAEIGRMWRMLTRSASQDYRLEMVGIVPFDAISVRAKWRAHYTFSQTGRAVVNEIISTLVIERGLIVMHEDIFDFPAWAAQALGLPGQLLGKTGFMRRKVQAEAAKRLAAFKD